MVIQELISYGPITAILGARQCGKTTLAGQIPSKNRFDLENPVDLRRLENPKMTLESLKGLIVIDEIQRKPDLFPLLRYLVDTTDQKYLILGSASRDLIQNSSESLAGRISFYTLNGFGVENLKDSPEDLKALWFRGGFPRSFLAGSDEQSRIWRENYIRTYLERDIPQLGIAIPSATLRRFWIMLSHYHGNLLNYSELARAFGRSDKTVKNYLSILQGTFMIRLLQPWYVNLKKRLVKAPKLYIRDSGLFHSLQAIDFRENLYSHIKLGASWEGFVIEQAARFLVEEELFFYRTHNGTELDLFWRRGGRNYGLEVKYGDAPSVSTSMKIASRDLELDKLFVVYPGKERYPLTRKIEVLSLEDFIQEISSRHPTVQG